MIKRNTVCPYVAYLCPLIIKSLPTFTFCKYPRKKSFVVYLKKIQCNLKCNKRVFVYIVERVTLPGNRYKRKLWMFI